MNTQNITLYFKDAKSDKQYNASLEKSGKLFVVNFAYGKRGGNLKEGTKTKTPVTYEKALLIYKKLVKSKTDKGYKSTGEKQVTKPSSKKSTKKPVVKSKAKANEKVRDTDELFTKIKGFVESTKSPVKFLKTINEKERNNLSRLVMDYMAEKKLLKRDQAIGINQIMYSFFKITARDFESSYWLIARITAPEVIDDLITTYCPDWLEQVSTLNYLDRMRYVKAGHLNAPFIIDKYKNKARILFSG